MIPCRHLKVSKKFKNGISKFQKNRDNFFDVDNYEIYYAKSQTKTPCILGSVKMTNA
jgi:hypothetical protein